jgi:hypothetical protein
MRPIETAFPLSPARLLPALLFWLLRRILSIVAFSCFGPGQRTAACYVNHRTDIVTCMRQNRFLD